MTDAVFSQYESLEVAKVRANEFFERHAQHDMSSSVARQEEYGIARKDAVVYLQARDDAQDPGSVSIPDSVEYEATAKGIGPVQAANRIIAAGARRRKRLMAYRYVRLQLAKTLETVATTGECHAALAAAYSEFQRRR